MRLVIALAIALGVTASAGAKEVVIPMTLERLPDEHIERQFEQLKQSLRSKQIPMSWSSDAGRIHRLRVRGSLPTIELGQLLKDARAIRMQFLSQTGDEAWDVDVIVSNEFSKVHYFFSCGELCAKDIDLVFQKKSDTWKYVYKLGPRVY